MNKKENVLFTIHNLSNGGAERVMSYLTVGFPSEKYNKYLVVYNRCDVEYDFDAECISLDLVSRSNTFSKLYNNVSRIYKIRKLKKQLNISKSISLLDNPNIMNVLSKRDEKVIVSIRNYKSGEVKEGIGTKIYKFIGRFIYGKADKIVAISEGVKNDLIQNFNVNEKKVEVIYNPIDIEKVINLKNEVLQEDNELFNGNVIINVGRLTKQKGQWHLIRAFSKVVNEIPDAKLVILGEGELREYLQRIIRDFNLEENVFLLGYKKNPFKYLAKSKLFVLSSLYEGFGNVIIEAMTCGTSVISTDCKYGPREIITGHLNLENNINKSEYSKFGILVPRLSGIQYSSNDELDDMEIELGNTIINTLQNKDIIEKYESAGEVRSKDFNYENIIDKWIKL